jgi:hypothetical protein
MTPHQPKEAHKEIEAGETRRSVARTFNVNQRPILGLVDQ